MGKFSCLYTGLILTSRFGRRSTAGASPSSDRFRFGRRERSSSAGMRVFSQYRALGLLSLSGVRRKMGRSRDCPRGVFQHAGGVSRPRPP
eukprot:3111634-Prymnesium_polylepis.1